MISILAAIPWIVALLLVTAYFTMNWTVVKVLKRYYVLAKEQFDEEAQKAVDAGEAGFMVVSTAAGNQKHNKPRGLKIVKKEDRET